MRFSVITANYNGGRYLEAAMRSVLMQKDAGVDLEYIVVDGRSTDNSSDIINEYRGQIDCLIVETDSGPANAINKGFAQATGDVVSWLNADDTYYPGALKRVEKKAVCDPDAAFFFGACPIIDTKGREIRAAITRFKAIFFPVSSRFTFQCLNYISQPATFFRRRALQEAGPLDERLTAAWDYEFFLRLWRQGRAVRITGPPLAAFRWHETSIGGRQYGTQFKEELACCRNDAGPLAPQTLIHHGVRWGIVGIYSLMALLRARQDSKRSGR